MERPVEHQSNERAPQCEHAPKAPAGDNLLSIVAAAKALGMSMPYVVMLRNLGKLGPLETAADGTPAIRQETVDRYIRDVLSEHRDAPNLRQAGIDAGFYDHDDGYFSNIVRGSDDP